ncbi:hypothetical protein NRL19_21715 (plasmid) [Aeromonas caviae]|uniref:rolling circle replication-associated protein n=1 Tax=Aeromonas caviae TaxID=648 RepID=UPI0024CD5CB9|nr:hypothetical protein NRL03_21670 [Aeromonas caviae]WAF66399.1 hypothetical protein NRL19_21715 [Aeromonas caviae]
MEAKTADAKGGFLPCLNSNISTEIASTQHRKSASALGWNVFALAQKHGLENLGFLTLTFKDHVLDVKEAQRRLNSLLTHIIKPRYQDYIGVLERQKSGRIHYHLLVVIGFDIRTGFDFAAVDAKDYSSANPALRAEWAFWRKTAPAYGFGRTELMPIKSSEEAIGKYIGKYIGKHMESRQEGDKGARLVRYSRGARVASTRFQFVSSGSQEWRSKLRAFAHYVAERTGCEPTMEGIREVCGPRWAYSHREFIHSMPAATHAAGCDVGAHGAGGAVACEAETVGVPPTPRPSALATPSGYSRTESIKTPPLAILCHSDHNQLSSPLPKRFIT